MYDKWSAINLRGIKRGLAGLGPFGAGLAPVVPVERVEADGEAEGVQDLVLHGAQQRLQLLRLRAYALRAEVRVTRYRPAKSRYRPRRYFISFTFLSLRAYFLSFSFFFFLFINRGVTCVSGLLSFFRRLLYGSYLCC